ncbi:DUF987 family protein [Providencia stuartii]|uniref:DUF987 family protein n=1 Tax=Morganellaceae TaxID=1903414 RepID=UPI0030F223F3
MNIIRKSAAMKIHQQHLGSRLARYCRGKYKWVGNSEHYIGKEVPDCRGVLAVYVERRQDRDGAYACVMCVTLN